MKIEILTFGITRDILGTSQLSYQTNENNCTVGVLRKELEQKHPQLTELNSLFIAVNEEYAEDKLELKEHDKVALIPPVSGG